MGLGFIHIKKGKGDTMKKLSCILVIVSLVLSASTLALAQEKGLGREGVRFGFGAALGKEVVPMDPEGVYLFNTVDFPSFYFPIHFLPHFMIEPFFGYWRYSENGNHLMLMNFGTGIFYTRWCGAFNLYFGGRVGLMKVSIEDEDITSSRMDWIFGPAIGGECFVCTNLSLGGELQFNYRSLGNWKQDGDEIDSDHSQKLMYTKTLFFIRWYLGCR